MKRMLMCMLIIGGLAATSIAGAVTISLSATGDSYVHTFRPNDNYGTGHGVSAGVLDDSTALISFDVTDAVPTDQVLVSAVLWMYESGAAGSDDSVIGAHEVTGAWTESTVTYNNRPSYSGTTLDTQTIPFVNYRSWWQWDVTAAFPGTGNFDLALVGESGFAFRTFVSREATINSPYLEITYIPEPATLALLGLGALAIRRKRK